MIKNNIKQVRVRMAPSPTGAFHIGSARTALFNYLFAKKNKGTFILRIEDTDEQRSKKEWEDNIKKSLNWLNILSDESPDIPGSCGPYRQSERKEIYSKHLKKLIEEKKVYYCFCSQEDLESHRQYLMSIGKPPCYSGKCRQLTDKEVQEKMSEGKSSFVLRFKTPSRKVKFEDMLRGVIEYDSDNFGDFVVAKDLTTVLYNLACVIDDFEMQISHIIRGEEHISNTPKQILIAEALNIQTPQYLHLPLILDQNRAKLSKRNPEVSSAVMDYKKKGYLAEALVNFIALLGWNPGTKQEVFSMEELIDEFSVDRIQKAGAVFNVKKLDWLNGFYIRKMPLDKLTEICCSYLQENGFISRVSDEPGIPFKNSLYLADNKPISGSGLELKKIIGLYQERLKKLSEISELVDFFFKDKLDFPKELLRWKNFSDEEIKDSLNTSMKMLDNIEETSWTKEKLADILLKEAEKTGDRGKLLWPLRAALSGKKASAGPFEIAELLGKEKTINRLKQAIEKL